MEKEWKTERKDKKTLETTILDLTMASSHNYYQSHVTLATKHLSLLLLLLKSVYGTLGISGKVEGRERRESTQTKFCHKITLGQDGPSATSCKNPPTFPDHSNITLSLRPILPLYTETRLPSSSTVAATQLLSLTHMLIPCQASLTKPFILSNFHAA